MATSSPLLDEELESRVLHIGDYICLFNKETKEGGFVYSDLSSEVTNGLFFDGSTDQARPTVGNIKACVFQVLAPNKYKDHKVYRRELAKLSAQVGNNPGVLEHDPQLIVLRKRAKIEAEDNVAEQKRQHNKRVVYGQRVELKHVYTNRFVRVSTTSTSITESTNMQVELSPDNAKHCQFRLMPRFKVRSEGDLVRFNDHITLESFKTKLQYLHCSGTHTLPETHIKHLLAELNLSVSPSTFVLLSHSDSTITAQRNVKGCSVIQLFHKEVDCFLASEGPPFDIPGNGRDLQGYAMPQENVHLRARHESKFRTNEKSTAAVTFWQIEIATLPICGRTATWRNTFRLRHMCNQMYLAVVKDLATDENSLTLVKHGTDEELTFRFAPVLKTQHAEPISFGTTVRIHHIHSEQWVHAGGFGLPYLREQYRGMDEADAAPTDGADGEEAEGEDEEGVMDADDETGKTTKKTGLAAIRWDKAELQQVTVTPKRHFDDAFVILEVEQSLVDDLHYVAGLVEPLVRFNENRALDMPFDLRENEQIMTLLDNLSSFLVIHGEPVKTRQKLLRNINLNAFLLRVLRSLFSDYAGNEHRRHAVKLKNLRNEGDPVILSLKELCTSIYSVLSRYVTGKSRKNKLSLVKFIPVFQKQLGKGLDSAMTLLNSLIQGNREIIDRFDNTQIDRYVRRLRKQDRKFQYLNFMSVLCDCQSTAMARHQQYICKTLIVESTDADGINPLLCALAINPPGTDHENSVAKIVYVSYSGRKNDWVPLWCSHRPKNDLRQPCPRKCNAFGELALENETLVRSGMSIREKDKPEYNFFLAQLNLFAKLCFRRHQQNIEILTNRNLFSVEMIMECLKSPMVPKAVRSALVDIMTNWYIDVAPNRTTLDNPRLTYIFNAVGRKRKELELGMATTGATMAFFKPLNEWVFKYINEQRVLYSEDKANNKLLRQVLRVIKYLVDYGYYWDSRLVSDLAAALLEIIDGTNDMPNEGSDRDPTKLAEFRALGRFEDNPNNALVGDVRHTALEVMDLLFTFRFNRLLENFIMDFKRAYRKSDSERPRFKLHERSFNLARKFVSVLFDRSTENWDSFQYTDEYVNLIWGLIPLPQLAQKAEAEGRRDVRVLPPTEMEHYIRVLFQRTNYIEFAAEKMSYLGQPGVEFDDSVLLTDYEGIPTLAKILVDCMQYKHPKVLLTSTRLLNRFWSIHVDLCDLTITTQVAVHGPTVEVYEHVSQNLPDIRRLRRVKMLESEENLVVKLLNEFAVNCRLNRADPNSLPHPMNQAILSNEGIMADIFDLLAMDFNPAMQLRAQYQGVLDIFHACFELLRELAKKNPPIQEQVFNKLSILMAIPCCEQVLGRLLCEVFGSNKSLSLQVPPQVIRDIMGLIAKQNIKAPSLVQALMSLVLVQDLSNTDEPESSIERNQILVIKALTEHRREVLQPAYLDDEDNEEFLQLRFDLVSSGSDENGNPWSMPAYGQHIGKEKGGSLWTQEQLDYNMWLVDLLASCARGGNRYVISVLQATISIHQLLDLLNEQNTALIHKRPYIRFLLYVHLATTATLGRSAEARAIVYEKLFWRFMSVYVVGYVDRLAQLIAGLNDVKEALPEWEHNLLYEALLPYFETFFKEYYDPEDLRKYWARFASEADFIEPIGVIETLAKNFQELVRASVVVHMDIPRQCKAIKNTADAMFERVVGFSNNSSQLAVSSKSKTRREARYDAEYEDEVQVNIDLNKFAFNLKTSYRRANTAVDQLVYVPRAIAREDRKYLESEEGDELLPLGREFQHFVRTFLSYEQSRKGFTVDHIRAEICALITLIRRALKSKKKLGEAERVDRENLTIKAMQVLRAMLHNDLCLMPEKFQAADPLVVAINDDVEYVQNTLDHYGVMVAIIPLLSSSNIAISSETLALMSALLTNGNNRLQTSFLEYCRSTNDTAFFKGMASTIEAAKSYIIEERTLQQLSGDGTEKADSTQHQTQTLSKAKRNKSTKTDKAAKGKGPVGPDGPVAKSREQDAVTQFAEKKAERNPGDISLPLRVLQRLCEGHNRDLQDLLRTGGVNLVHIVTEFLAVLQAAVTQRNVGLTVQCLDTLLEFAQDNKGNQQDIVDAQAVDSINALLRDHYYDKVNLLETAQLKLGALKLLSSFMESQDPASAAVAAFLLTALDITALFETIQLGLFFYQNPTAGRAWGNAKTLTAEGDDNIADDWLSIGLEGTKVLMRISDFTQKDFVKVNRNLNIRGDMRQYMAGHFDQQRTESLLEQWERTNPRPFEYLRDRMRSVEILREDQVHKTYFPFINKQSLRDEVKDSLKFNADTTSPGDKISYLFTESSRIIGNMEHRMRMSAHPIAGIFVRNTSLWRFLILWITFSINIIILATWDADVNFQATKPVTPPWWDTVLLILGICHVVVSTIMLVAFLLSFPLRNPLDLNQPFFDRKVFHVIFAPFFRRLRAEEARDDRRADQLARYDGGDGNEILKSWEHQSSAMSDADSIFTGQTFYYLVFLAMSVLGIFTDGYTYGFHLIHIVTENDILSRAIQSVTRNGKSLLLVAALMMTILYIYAMAIFIFARRSVDRREDLYCDTLGRCFLTALTNGLRAGLGDVVRPPYVFGYATPGTFFIFDMSVFIIINIIGLNVILGIIVDTFSNLREEKRALVENLASECFICSRKRYEFESAGGLGYEDHIRTQHNMFYYLYYMMYLRITDPNDYTGIESYVSDLIQNKGSTDFFPTSRALVLQETKNDLKMRLHRLEGNLRRLDEHFVENAEEDLGS